MSPSETSHEELECIGGVMDGMRMLSRGFPDREVWPDGSGQYIRTPGRYCKAQRGNADPTDPLAELIADAWVWHPSGEHA